MQVTMAVCVQERAVMSFIRARKLCITATRAAAALATHLASRRHGELSLGSGGSELGIGLYDLLCDSHAEIDLCVSECVEELERRE